MMERVIRTLEEQRVQPSLQNSAACQPRDRRLDSVLQPSMAPSEAFALGA
ncbi:hypothetical protein DM75_2928 [Burkholderia mallei]|nr:hypothetical protein DM75_2928 [Burkholderia mallei]KOT22375.1 hypothetical protein DM52_1997 [Burkholderia mallei]